MYKRTVRRIKEYNQVWNAMSSDFNLIDFYTWSILNANLRHVILSYFQCLCREKITYDFFIVLVP